MIPRLRKILIALAALATLAVLATQAPAASPLRVLTMGDSLMATHGLGHRAVPDAIRRTLGATVVDRSVMGARMIYGLPISGALGFSIPKQYRPGKWDWIVLNGGGNDLWLGCGCNRCARKLNRLIAPDGKAGAIPRLLSRLRRTGARVIYVGYLRSPGVGSPIEACKDEGDELEGRIQSFAKTDNGVFFLSLAHMVPYGDRSYHAFDMIHPSLKASREIGQRIARLIGR